MNHAEVALSAPTEGVTLSLEQCDELLVSGMHSIRDAILGYTKQGLTQPQISERVKTLGFKASLRTIKRHVADLRDEGLLPAVQPGSSDRTERWRRQQERERQRGHFGPIATQPTPPTNTDLHYTSDCILVSSEPVYSSEPISQRVPGIQPKLEPYRGGQYEGTVSMGTEAERDYEEVLKHFAVIFKITGKYITGGWTEEQWNGIGGECRTLEDDCNSHCANLRKRFEQSRREFLDSFNASRASGLCEGSADFNS